MSRRRILTVIETLGRGGAERLLLTLHRQLDPERFDPMVVALFEPSPLASELEAIGVDVRRLSLPGPRHLPTAVARLRSIIRDWQPDVVHTHLYCANIAGRLAASGLAPVFTTLHNPDYGFEDPGTTRFRVKKWLDRTTGLRLTARMIAVSAHVRDDFERELGFTDIEVLHNFIDVREFSETREPALRRSSRAALQIDDEEFVILHVGRLHHQKGQDVLLRGLAMMPSRRRWRAVFVGAGDPTHAQALATDLEIADRVAWTGSVDEVRPYYAAADVFAFPSRYEAFGIALLEAMACGLPAVVSDAAGMSELATADTALITPVGEVEALAAALGHLRVDPDLRRRLGAAAAERAWDFDVSRQLPSLERWYEDA